MEYEVEIDFGSGGICPVTIEVDDSSVADYARYSLGMTDEPEQWTHDHVPADEWLDNEDDPEGALDWVLKNVPTDAILSALEAKLKPEG
ncbi:MAG: hypothetical protein Unbinned5081contig1000_52 [Prokaryotic dsDNA virus sp.]|nr:MAG: hypothetical protein Unbinned5081contig1000_52 [Prokaryotic dsDNA virus sp.]|tara:strand:- start:19334 stop:19600 length:267 start_codon:yes stop_codon:yes gene_type:complete